MLTLCRINVGDGGNGVESWNPSFCNTSVFAATGGQAS